MFDISLLTASADMNWFEAIVLSLVEGLTEFLPVSSTGHMIITEGLFHMESTPFVKAFTVIIQFGAILSVVCLYWRRFFNPPVEVGKNTSWWGRIWPFYLKLIVGVLPAVVVGLKLGDFIDENLGSVNTVAAMLIIGGVFMLYCDKLFNKGSEQTPLTYKRALMVGLYQCIAALLPGTSRSMATIVGGMQQKLTRKAAAEFSFFLAVPTMFGATCKKVYDLLKDGTGDALLQGNHLTLLLAGNIIAFLVAILAIKFFLNYVTKYGFKAFGWYRIIVGLLIFGMALCGYPLTMAD